MHRTIILLLLATIILTACGHVPDTCQVGVPTNKPCFSAQGNNNTYSIGPFTIFSGKF